MLEATVTSLPPSATSGFLAPPPPPVGMRLNKPAEIGNAPNRLQQTSSIGMAHPTFRSDFNVTLRYFCLFVFFSLFSSLFRKFLFFYTFAKINFCCFILIENP